MCEQQNTLPQSMCITLKRLGDRIPMYRGGSADVIKGEYDGSVVAVKVISIYLSSDLRKVARVSASSVRCLRIPCLS